METKTKKTFEAIAKEELTVEIISGTAYAFGSELATLRLYKTYIHSVNKGFARQAFSENRQAFFFSLDLAI